MSELITALETARYPLLVGMGAAIWWLVKRLNKAEDRERALQERLSEVRAKLAAASERNALEYRELSKTVFDAIGQLERTVLARGRHEGEAT